MIVRADARRIPLADETVQCVVTSPPYWGLRKYTGEQDLIWGGDANCAHEFDTHEVAKENFQSCAYGRGLETSEWREGFCHCGAWRGAYGLEPTVEMYVAHTVEILREIRRVLRKDGVVFWNIGDSYAGSGKGSGGEINSPKQRSNAGSYFAAEELAAVSKSKRIMRGKGRWGGGNNYCALKPKDLCLIPARVALAAQSDGWWVRSRIIWAKPNPMPESVTDRPTDAYEEIILLTKSAQYFWDAEAVKEKCTESRDMYANPSDHLVCATNGGYRNMRNVWTFPTQPYSGAHFATFPEEIPRRAILAGTSSRGACARCGAPRTVGWEPSCKCGCAETRPCLVLDPFGGSGTTGRVATELNRNNCVLLDLAYTSEAYAPLAIERMSEVQREIFA